MTQKNWNGNIRNGVFFGFQRGSGSWQLIERRISGSELTALIRFDLFSLAGKQNVQ